MKGTNNSNTKYTDGEKVYAVHKSVGITVAYHTNCLFVWKWWNAKFYDLEVDFQKKNVTTRQNLWLIHYKIHIPGLHQKPFRKHMSASDTF